MYRIAVCDDDLIFAAELVKQIKSFFERYALVYNLSFFNSFSILEDADSKEAFDLIFLSVFISDESGIEFAKKLRNRDRNMNIIFTAPSADLAIDSFEAFPLYYLIKPLDPVKLETALSHALRFSDRSIPFVLPHTTQIIDPQEICYLEVIDHTVMIHKTNGEIQKISGNLKELEAKFPPLIFVRIHRKYLVNVRYIESIGHYYVQLPGRIRLPVARNRFVAIQAALMDGIQKKSLLP